MALFNALGQRVLQQELPATRGTAAQALPLGAVAPGVYVLRVGLPEGVVTKRVVVE